MAIGPFKPGGYAVNEELTSAQMNTLQASLVTAVDKTGDVLTSGTIQLTSAAKIQASIHDSIISSVDSGISTTAARGISINNDTGLSLEGATCWPSFRSTRGYSVAMSALPGYPLTGWTYFNGLYLQNTTASSPAFFALPKPHHGATLASITVSFAVSTSHSSVPALLPSINILRQQSLTTTGVGVLSGLANLRSAGPSSPATPVSGATWYASGNVQTWTGACDQNNVIDRTQYNYYLQFNDESGAGSIVGSTVILGFVLTYTGIAGMQFQ